MISYILNACSEKLRLLRTRVLSGGVKPLPRRNNLVGGAPKW